MFAVSLMILFALIAVMLSQMAQAVSKAPPYEWYLWGESAAKNGFTGVTSKAGYPDTYSQTGDTVTLRDLGGRAPWYRAGLAIGVTKTGGGRFKGSKSYGSQYHYVPGAMGPKMARLTNQIAREYQRGEVITGEADSANTNEVTALLALFTYGGPGHPYPPTIQDLARMVRAKVIHCPQFSVTSGAAITAGSGAVTLDSASQEDLWIKDDVLYYILGAVPHLVNNAGLLEFSGGLPNNEFHSNCLPLGNGAQPVTFDSDVTWPYEPIGPFTSGAFPKVGLYSVAAAATTFGLIIAEV